MEKLEELYYITFNNNCFEDVYKRGVCHIQGSLNFHYQENNDHDSLLVALTVVQKLYQNLATARCQYLRVITDDLVAKNYLMDSLLKCLGHKNQHVVFSATKAIVLVFQMLPKRLISPDWIKMLFNFNCPGEETDYPWRKLYTMEILRKVVKNSRVSQKRKDENAQLHQRIGACHCKHETNSVDHTAPSNNLAELFLEDFNLNHILFHYIPFVVRPNGIYSFMKSCQHVGIAEDFVVFQAGLKLGEAIHNQENVKQDAIFGNKESNLVAFLRCVTELVKYLQDNKTPQEDTDAGTFIQNENSLFSPMETNSTESTGGVMAGCCNISPSREETHFQVQNEAIVAMRMRSDMINQVSTVLPTLVEYLHSPRLPPLIFKRILEVLNQLLFAPSHCLFGQKSERTKLEKLTRISSVSFLDVFECCLHDKVPKCSGSIGFCGAEMKQFSGLTDGRHNDVIAWRTVSLILFKSCFVVLKSVSMKEGSSFFQRLSLSCITQWCNHILSLDCDVLTNNKTIKQHSEQNDFHSQLVALFVDQDDDLVEVLLLLLLLHQEIERSVPCSEISKTVLQQLNPHLLFEAFVHSIEFDHSVLLDLLISSETRFLEYVLKYLHLVVDDWKSFSHSVWNSEGKLSFKKVEENTGIDLSDEVEMYPDSVFCGKSSVVRDQSKSFHHEFNATEGLVLKKVKKQDKEHEDVLKHRELDDSETLSSRIVYKGGYYEQLSESTCLKPEYLCGARRLPETTLSSEQDHLPECKSLGNAAQESQMSGLRNIVAAYSSSDGSDLETEDDVENGFGCESDTWTVLASENLDKIMSMLIRLRMSLARLSRSGNFPYSSAPLLTLMERVEKYYDGC